MGLALGRFATVLFASLLLGGCDGDSVLPLGEGGSGGGTTTEPEVCEPGEFAHPAGGCCAAGTYAHEDSSCQPAGIPAEACGEGFVPNDRQGCEPILPTEPCGPGLMAVPGDETCREVAPCGAAPWGDIPIEGSTQHVDGAYGGADSDGTASRPWITVQAAVDAAEPGAVVAVAAGSYVEELVIEDKAVRLWGICPAQVELVGPGGLPNVVFVGAGADGTEIHTLAVTGQGHGVALRNGGALALDRVWIHDTSGHGVNLLSTSGQPARMALDGVLVERAYEIGVFVNAGQASFDRCAVRDTQPDAELSGRGINVQYDASTDARAELTMHSSLVEGSYEIGVFVHASDATIEGSVLRDTQRDATGIFGRSLAVRHDPDTGERGNLFVRTSIIEHSDELGVVAFASDADMEHTVVRSALPDAEVEMGRGVSVLDDPQGPWRASLQLRSSVIEQCDDLGMYISESDVTIDQVLVRDVQPNEDGRFGRGINVQDRLETGEGSIMQLRSSVIDQATEIGLFISASEADVERTLVRDTLSTPAGWWGRGVNIQDETATTERADVRLVDSVIERGHDVGIYIQGSDTSVTHSVVRGTIERPDGLSGDGVVALTLDGQQALLTLQDTHIQDNDRAGIVGFGSVVTIEGVWLQCNPIQLNGEQHYTVVGVPQSTPFVFEDLGGNECSCGDEVEACAVLSTGLAAPDPLPLSESP